MNAVGGLHLSHTDWTVLNRLPISTQKNQSASGTKVQSKVPLPIVRNLEIIIW